MWHVYILECDDSTYYTGYTNHLEERLAKHNDGSGAKYTRARKPVRLIYSEEQPDKSSAMKREAEIKNYTRKKKEKLVKTLDPRFSA